MDVSADVVIVGFGAAGACAAIEAARAGASVVVLDRFAGGGATALSGGVVYAGGGTRQQVEAGVLDSPDGMFEYLRHEVGDAVSGETLWRFCRGSADMLRWLEDQGVPFDASLCPFKTSYPTNDYYLYHSGSEQARRDVTPPAPRGHRAKGKGTSGALLFARLAASVHRTGAGVLPQTTAVELVTEDGRVTGVRCRRLTGAPRIAHRVLSRLAVKPSLYYPPVGRSLHRLAAALERRHGREVLVRANRGVVIAAGGFVFDRELMREHAPAYRGGLPLGTPGDDGSGIKLGTAVGGTTARMDRVSAWRFLTPPSALRKGVLVGATGRRVCDESLYGAAIGEAIVTGHEGRAWLLVDDEVLREARRQVPWQTLLFQRLQARYLLSRGLVTGLTLDEVAAKVGVDAAGLRATAKAYGDVPDALGKLPELVRPLRAPYSLIDVSVRSRVGYPCPVLTLGGLVVDEDTGRVTGVDGLYAAGRSAVGVCSESYVSGLSLADCVFSGRRAGAHVAKETPC
ncbi:FAD-binding protein [Umezawaea endophytica]|uniref:FAD-binding protein n=1 Tax=Umezawaea endophytica TaxID=1654476 RepID=A0A9X3AH72_9PSEU|nr:FAD-binding protein [Umezawaea endophytica]MCS7480616.1 FAD-binding protein [Umezawaea endophytica]